MARTTRLRDMGVLITGVALLSLLTGAAAVDAVSADRSFSVPVCPKECLMDSILGFRDSHCPVGDVPPAKEYPRFVAVTEGGEIWLKNALNMVHRNNCQYIAVLLYASWCPFSRSIGPSFSVMSSVYSSIPHFAIEESSVSPSVLSKYRVRGFPTLLLMNSTMFKPYHGPRTLESLVAFYDGVTGFKIASPTSEDKKELLHNLDEDDRIALETFPFTWAESPLNLLREETYLGLATIFVLLRFLYLCFPVLVLFALSTWRWMVQSIRMMEHPFAFLNRMVQLFKSLKESCKRNLQEGFMNSRVNPIQLFKSLKESCKRRNLQEGAMNARAWASKSLATVSFGKASTSRGAN